MVKGRLGEMEHMRRLGSEEAWRMRRGSCLRRWRLCSSGERNWTDERLRMPARTTGRHSSWLLSSEHSALAPCPRDGRLVRRSSQNGDVALPSLLLSSTQHCGPGHGTGTDPLQVIWDKIGPEGMIRSYELSLPSLDAKKTPSTVTISSGDM